MLEAQKIAQRQMEGKPNSKNKIPSRNEDFHSSNWFVLGYISLDTKINMLQVGNLRILCKLHRCLDRECVSWRITEYVGL